MSKEKPGQDNDLESQQTGTIEVGRCVGSKSDGGLPIRCFFKNFISVIWKAMISISISMPNESCCVHKDGEPTPTLADHDDEVALDVVGDGVDSGEEDTNDNDNNAESEELIDDQFEKIIQITKEKDLGSLREYGGLPVFAVALGTDLEEGIPSNDEHRCCRRQILPNTNVNYCKSPHDPQKGFLISITSPWRLLIKSPRNYSIILLILTALLSIGFGIKKEGFRTGWLEGFLILDVVLIILIVPYLRNLWNDSTTDQNKLLNDDDDGQMFLLGVIVVRGGTEQTIATSDVLLGDIICLKRGHQVPADGLFVSGDFLELLNDGSNAVVNEINPFLSCGAEVVNGGGRMLVTAPVGQNTVWGEMIMMMNTTSTKDFEAQLDKVSIWKEIIGILLYMFIIVVLFLHSQLSKEQVKSGFPDVKGKSVTANELKGVVKSLEIIMKPTSLAMLLLVGLVEGLPLCVALAIAYWKRKGVSFAHRLSACVAMSSVTTIICTDETGGLRLMEPLEVDKFWVGEEEITEKSVIASHVREAICDGISTTILLPQDLPTATDEPLLSWLAFKFSSMKDMETDHLRLYTTILDYKELSFDQEGRGVLMRKIINGDINESVMCLHWRGLATTILPMCSKYYDSQGEEKDLDEQMSLAFQRRVEHLQSTHDLKVIAFAYKKTFVQKIEETDLTLLGLVGLKMSSIREDIIKRSIKECENAGVKTILVSAANEVNTVVKAQRCGIILDINGNHDYQGYNHQVIKGHDFRNGTDDERMEMANRISVMLSALPSDKLLLVKCLKKKRDHSVAFIGVGTNDAPALKEADVGIAMGAWSTHKAKATSDIVIWEPDISFAYSLLRYGTCIYNNIQKYTQLELTMFVSWILITSISTVSSCITGNDHYFMPITTVELFWANLVVLMPGGLALLIEESSSDQRNEAVVVAAPLLITKAMWRNIFSQVIYQTTIVLVIFQYRGPAIRGAMNEKVTKTIIFNSFVLCEICNQLNARELVRKNVFRTIHKNHNCWFWGALGVSLLLQVTFIELEPFVFGNARLNWVQWCICLVIGMVSWAIDFSGKCILGFIKY